jgi:hypothetical protein
LKLPSLLLIRYCSRGVNVLLRRCLRKSRATLHSSIRLHDLIVNQRINFNSVNVPIHTRCNENYRQWNGAMQKKLPSEQQTAVSKSVALHTKPTGAVQRNRYRVLRLQALIKIGLFITSLRQAGKLLWFLIQWLFGGGGSCPAGKVAVRQSDLCFTSRRVQVGTTNKQQISMHPVEIFKISKQAYWSGTWNTCNTLTHPRVTSVEIPRFGTNRFHKCICIQDVLCDVVQRSTLRRTLHQHAAIRYLCNRLQTYQLH